MLAHLGTPPAHLHASRDLPPGFHSTGTHQQCSSWAPRCSEIDIQALPVSHSTTHSCHCPRCCCFHPDIQILQLGNHTSSLLLLLVREGMFSHRKRVAWAHSRNYKHLGAVPGVMGGIRNVTSEIDPCKQTKPNKQPPKEFTSR